MDRMEVDALALAIGEALGVGEASDFFPFAETLRGAQKARATQTLLMISDLFFIVGFVVLEPHMGPHKMRRGKCSGSSSSNDCHEKMQP
jgi:hypothetical protein